MYLKRTKNYFHFRAERSSKTANISGRKRLKANGKMSGWTDPNFSQFENRQTLSGRVRHWTSNRRLLRHRVVHLLGHRSRCPTTKSGRSHSCVLVCFLILTKVTSFLYSELTIIPRRLNSVQSNSKNCKITKEKKHFFCNNLGCFV